MATANTDPDDRRDGNGGLLSPVAFAVGVLSDGVRRVRELPTSAARIPVRGLNLAFVVTDKVQREAGNLQRRTGQVRDLIAALLGMAGEHVADDFAEGEELLRQARAEAGATGQAAAARVADLAEQAAGQVEHVAERVAPPPEAPAQPAKTSEPARRTARGGPAGTKPTTKRSAAAPRQPAKRTPARPEAGPAPSAEISTEISAEAAEAGAPGAARLAAARAESAAEAAKVVPGEELPAAELPLSDFDHLSIGSLRSRLPRLDRDQLVQLLSYERAHADRLQVVTMLENRIAKVEGEAAAAPPSGETAQQAAEEFGSNSPHP